MVRRLIFTNRASHKGPVGNYIPGAHVGPRSRSVRRALMRRAAVRYDEQTKKSYNPCCSVMQNQVISRPNTDTLPESEPESEPGSEPGLSWNLSRNQNPPSQSRSRSRSQSRSQSQNPNQNRTRTRT